MKRVLAALAIVAACASSSGLIQAQTLSTPVKYPGNPIWDQSGAWDKWPTYVNEQLVGGVFTTWYSAYHDSAVNTGSEPALYCYATSTDLNSFSKPDLGQYTFGGNTNNNIMSKGVMGCYTNGQYVGVSNRDAYGYGSNGGLWVYSSSDGSTWTYRSQVGTWTNWGVIKDLGDIQQVNGVWYLYYQAYSTTARGVGYFTASSLDGPWTDHGTIIPAADAQNQRYSFRLQRELPPLAGYTYMATIDNFGTGVKNGHDSIYSIGLWASVDGIAWVELVHNWLVSSSNPGDWDYGLIFSGSIHVDPANAGQYRVDYTGSPTLHDEDYDLGGVVLSRGYATFTVSGAVTLPAIPALLGTAGAPSGSGTGSLSVGSASLFAGLSNPAPASVNSAWGTVIRDRYGAMVRLYNINGNPL